MSEALAGGRSGERAASIRDAEIGRVTQAMKFFGIREGGDEVAGTGDEVLLDKERRIPERIPVPRVPA